MEKEQIKINRSDIGVLDFILDKIVDKGRVEESDMVDGGYINKDIPKIDQRRQYLYYVPILDAYCGSSHGVDNGYIIDLDTRTLNFYRNGGFKGAYRRQIKRQTFSFIIAYVPIIISIIAISIAIYQCNDSNNNDLEIYKTNNRIDSVNVKIKGIEYYINSPFLNPEQSRWSQEKQSP